MLRSIPPVIWLWSQTVYNPSITLLLSPPSLPRLSPVSPFPCPFPSPISASSLPNPLLSCPCPFDVQDNELVTLVWLQEAHMVPVEVDAAHLQYFYDLLARGGSSVLEVANEGLGISLYLAQSKATARDALFPQVPRPTSLPAHPHSSYRPSEPSPSIKLRVRALESSAPPPGEHAESEFDDPDISDQDLEALDGGRTRTRIDREGGVRLGEGDVEGRDALLGGDRGKDKSDTEVDSGAPAAKRDGATQKRPRGKGDKGERPAKRPAPARKRGDGTKSSTKADGTKSSTKADGTKSSTKADGTSAGEARDRESPVEDPRRAQATAWLAQRVADSEDQSVRATSAKLQGDLVDNALAVAGGDAVARWYDIIHHWRNNGELVTIAYEGIMSRHGSQSPRHPPPVSASSRPPPAGPNGRASTRLREKEGTLIVSPSPTITRQRGALRPRASVDDFCLAYRSHQFQDIVALLQPVVRLCSLPTLFRRYSTALAEIEAWYGKRAREQRKDAKVELFQACYPQWARVETPSKNEDAKPDWRSFDNALLAANRMHTLEEGLGFGIFSLLPNRAPKKFFTHTIRLGHLPLWMEMVRRFNPAYQAVRLRVDALLRWGVAGNSLAIRTSRKRLLIERMSKETAIQHRDPGPLFEVADPTAISDPGTTTPNSRPTTARGVTNEPLNVSTEVMSLLMSRPGEMDAGGDGTASFWSYWGDSLEAADSTGIGSIMET